MTGLEVGLLVAMVLMTGAWIAALAALRISRQLLRDIPRDIDEKYRDLFVTYSEYVTPIKVMRLRNACEDLLVHTSSSDGWVPRADRVGLPATDAFERDMRALQAAVTDLGKATR